MNMSWLNTITTYFYKQCFRDGRCTQAILLPLWGIERWVLIALNSRNFLFFQKIICRNASHDQTYSKFICIKLILDICIYNQLKEKRKVYSSTKNEAIGASLKMTNTHSELTTVSFIHLKIVTSKIRKINTRMGELHMIPLHLKKNDVFPNASISNFTKIIGEFLQAPAWMSFLEFWGDVSFNVESFRGSSTTNDENDILVIGLPLTLCPGVVLCTNLCYRV